MAVGGSSTAKGTKGKRGGVCFRPGRDSGRSSGGRKVPEGSLMVTGD